MEIISEPQFTDGNDATAYVRELQRILQTVGTCDGKMSGMLVVVLFVPHLLFDKIGEVLK